MSDEPNNGVSGRVRNAARALRESTYYAVQCGELAMSPMDILSLADEHWWRPPDFYSKFPNEPRRPSDEEILHNARSGPNLLYFVDDAGFGRLRLDPDSRSEFERIVNRVRSR